MNRTVHDSIAEWMRSGEQWRLGARSKSGSAASCDGHRRGLSLVEVLTVIGIIGALIAIGLPGIQRSRESARRVDCSSRLRELMRGAHAFHVQNGRFPGYYATDNAPEAPIPAPTFSVHFWILPHIDQRAIFERVDQRDVALDLWKSPPSSGVNGGILNKTIPLFQCPSDIARPGSVNYRACTGTTPGASHETINIPPPAAALRGFVRRRGLRMNEITDGLSNTVGFSERMIGGGQPGPLSTGRGVLLLGGGVFTTPDDAMAGCQTANLSSSQDAFAGSAWLPAGYHTTWYNHVQTPNAKIPDCTTATAMNNLAPGAFTARSPHDGGVFVAKLDSSNRFVNSNIALEIWRALATIKGHESVSEY